VRGHWTPSLSFLAAFALHVFFLLLIGRHYLASSATPQRLNKAAQKLTTVNGQPVRFVYVKDMVSNKQPPLDRSRLSDADRQGASAGKEKGRSPDPTSYGASPIRQSGGPADAAVSRPSIPPMPASPPPGSRPGTGGQNMAAMTRPSPPVRAPDERERPTRNAGSKQGPSRETPEAKQGLQARAASDFPAGSERAPSMPAAAPGNPAPPGPSSPGGLGTQLQQMMVGSLQGGYYNPNASRLNTGTLSFDTAAWDLGPYARQVQERVQANWHVPEAQMVLRQKGWVAIRFNVQKDGTVTDLQVLRASGIPSYDQSALDALRSSSPLPPLPSQVTVPQIGGVFRFFYNMSFEGDQ
jgi:protein TonB